MDLQDDIGSLQKTNYSYLIFNRKTVNYRSLFTNLPFPLLHPLKGFHDNPRFTKIDLDKNIIKLGMVRGEKVLKNIDGKDEEK